MAKPVVKLEYYKVVYEFDPRNPDEMALEEGDIVLVSLFVHVFSVLQYRATCTIFYMPAFVSRLALRGQMLCTSGIDISTGNL